MPVSIIIPVLNEEDAIKALLHQLQDYRQRGHEVIVVDGGSEDKTIEVAKPLADKVILSQAGRAQQMNNGAIQASKNILWFLHADTDVAAHAIDTIEKELKHRNWGRFNIRLSGQNILFRIIEKMINLRSSVSGIATGDQGIFVKQSIFNRVNGYTDIPLMEDVDLSKKLRKISHPACVKDELVTSSRRWEKNGILSTVLLMWRLRFLFWTGVSTDKLAKLYRNQS